MKIRDYIPTRVGFGKGLKEAADQMPEIIGLGADITGSVNMNFFAEAHPDRFYSLGIAEQNITGVAVGLALEGKIPVMATYGVFSAMRNTDQVRISVCYNNLHVIIGGAHAGISVGPDGATHQALEDIAIMRSLPNMTVLSPCDATQANQAIKAALTEQTGPVYLRFGREAVPDFIPDDIKFEIGKAQLLKTGEDLTIVATGHLVWEALEAAKELESGGVSARVINLHTIKPIDKETLIKASAETGAIVTAEEHQIMGGMGSAVAEVLSEYAPCPMKFIGVNDTFGESGQPDELMKKYKLKSKDIVTAAHEVLINKAKK
ncbi:1-deoxy-D-xylulose-5-phosphate synthase [Salinivirga cyanobacteriivorans]|uniref:1-deoxy-D-xylulose-5-phosphate synthase n=1 Tax=Salinivirga cyanobacteriivorans TaxID=1307839 RepID=A0A0S2HYS9_9BACT|nr:transketolase C-terminal domain-containing protein [Salinivirga cyanobacteriivorans]ALO15176.1 1-deoxy-D-xylulose-5-phosphate synthase [Salinivirga cyanobacteriivorans]